jgi:hypothetical protein
MKQNVCILQQYVGAIKLLENENVVWNRINTGDRQPIQFHLYFPLSWPLPTVRSITSNGNVICIGDTPSMYYIILFIFNNHSAIIEVMVFISLSRMSLTMFKSFSFLYTYFLTDMSMNCSRSQLFLFAFLYFFLSV